MNISVESEHGVKRDRARIPKFISSLATRLGMVLMALRFLLAVPCVKAQTAISMTDTNFILAAAQGGMTEVKLGELASTSGMREDVKAFGRMMVKDHTAINEDLKALAAQKGVTLPQSLDAEHQGIVDKMMALNGLGFDDAYINDMIQIHQKDAKAFRAESAATQDPGIKYFLDTSIPVVESHLQQATLLKK
jgi:putative membrane protein